MANQPLLRLVTVDVTNTLIRVVGSPGYQYAYIGRKHGVTMDENVLNGLFLKYYKQYTQKYPNFGVQDMMPAHVWWDSLVKDCFRAADSSIQEDKLDKIATDLFFHYTTPKAWEILPGALGAIKDLRKYPIKIGVISNWDHRLYKVLLTMKLRPYFDFILPSSVVGVEKPDSLIFQQALKDAQCQPDEAIHFGDSLEKDFIGAQNVGMGAYLLATGQEQYSFLDPSLVVESVPAFVEAIRPKLTSAKEQQDEATKSAFS